MFDSWEELEEACKVCKKCRFRRKGENKRENDQRFCYLFK